MRFIDKGNDMKKYQYEIFQTDADQEFAFRRWDVATRHGWSFDLYRSVWVGKEEARDDMDLLDYLYEVFNEHRPNGFRGHSLSVSDIIRVQEEDKAEFAYYYCDSFGWANVTKEILA